MATNNEIDTGKPIEVSHGGTSTNTLTQYGVLYGNGTSAVGVTVAGTSGYVLTSDGGTGNAPTWQPYGSGVNGLVLISTTSVTSGTSITITSGFSASYNTYMFQFSGVYNSGSDILGIQVSTNGGSSYISSGYQAGCMGANNASGIVYYNSNATTYIPTSSGTTPYLSGVAWFYGMTSGSNMQGNGMTTRYESSLGANTTNDNWCATLGSGSINAIKFYSVSSTAFSYLIVSMYGLGK